MDNLQKLQAANPHIAIHTIHEAAFRRYGSVIQEDTSAFCAAAETIPFPETGSKYVASTPELDEIPAAARVREIYCGGLDEQIGLCWGHSNQLNALEWHTCNEFNIAVRELVLLLAKREDLDEDDLGLRTLFNNGLEIKIVGIIRQNDDAVSAMMTGSIGYTHELVEYVVEQAAQKDLVKQQLADPKTDVFSDLPFLDKDDEALTDSRKAQAARDYIDSADDEQLADLYVKFMSIPEDDYVQDLIDEQMEDTTRADLEDMILDYYPSYASMLEDMDDDTLFEYMEQMMAQQIEEQYGAQMERMYGYLSDSQLARDFTMLSLEEDDYIWLYDHAMPPVYSTGSYEENLKKLGYVDLGSPSTINLYASTFEDKDGIADAIEDYNNQVEEEDQIEYTDVVALLMSSITTIINVISYVLIAFVAISLVVSSIMIGIITYISVLERTKEIGILRAMGASKRDISRVFNAETLIVGFAAGAIGIGVTLLLLIPANAIVYNLTGISGMCVLPWQGAVILVIISMLLTLIAGLIPSHYAAKKDPVLALRSE